MSGSEIFLEDGEGEFPHAPEEKRGLPSLPIGEKLITMVIFAEVLA